MSALPLIIRNAIQNWKILSYDEKDWCALFQGQMLRFRKGRRAYRENPLWEQLCEEENLPLNGFFDISKTEIENEFWHYFDYKYMKDVICENSNFLKEIKWGDLKLNHLSGEDSTIWIGNKGAHTSCHMDTYGCNIVAQIQGRKLWILIPPEEMDYLAPVRVPYEESSVYSSLNFYTPSLDILKITKAYKVILNPGEVLYIPKHWWHYVENLETAISINTWIPLESDNESRLEEALVRFYVSSICQMLTENDARKLLNPNEYELLSSPYEQESLQLFLIDYMKEKKEGSSHLNTLCEFEKFLDENGVAVPSFSTEEIREYVDAKSQEHNYIVSSIPAPKSVEDNSDDILLSKMLINSYCHPRVMASAKENFLKSNEFLEQQRTRSKK